MRKAANLATLAVALLTPALAWAHPQDASTALLAGFMHPLSGLDHVLAMIALGVWAAQLGGRAMWAVPTAFVAAMLAGGLIGLIGIDVTAVQPLLAATVLVLGIFIMSRLRASAAESALMAAAFAVFHGAAHMAQVPAGANLFAYGAGLVGATALLHIVGILAALAVRCRDNVLRVGAAPVAFAGMWLLASRIA